MTGGERGLRGARIHRPRNVLALAPAGQDTVIAQFDADPMTIIAALDATAHPWNALRARRQRRQPTASRRGLGSGALVA